MSISKPSQGCAKHQKDLAVLYLVSKDLAALYLVKTIKACLGYFLQNNWLNFDSFPTKSAAHL
ncbi:MULTISPECIES: hypothetical protein [unclassified Shewanella]|uniref:hypothetical protein n=1 Tax=unclassified Shewanella TaxID=196818 RepID=UPI0039B5CCCC